MILLGTAAAAPPQYWAFEPMRDSFSAQALLDLRSLNEAVAGQSGPIRASAQGGFVRGDGQPIRFWAVNSEVARQPFQRKPLGAQEPPDLKRHARFLAKRGVNLVRLHRQISPNPLARPLPAFTDINTEERDAIWRAVAALRQEGIYSIISPFWAGAMPLASGWIKGLTKAQQPWGLLFFDLDLQRAYKGWLKQLLSPINPHTGVPLGRDPSVAVLQIQNEDSLLFWTVDSIRGPHREALEAAFARFLAAKHGSVAQATARWAGEALKPDALDAGRVALLPIWELTQSRQGGRAARLADQTEFLATTMLAFNTEIVRYLREDLGVTTLVNAGNWKTASSARLNDAERWSYGAGEVDAANVYTTGVHQGQHAGWAIVNGDRFTEVSVLRQPQGLPLAVRQTADAKAGVRPFMITEGSWVAPSPYSAEGPFLVAAYSSLLGIDAYCWFNAADEGWSPPGSANGWLASQAKWSLGTPETLGSFPAAALAHRMGYISQAAPVLHEHRALVDLWARRAPLLSESPSFDPNRDAASPASRNREAGALAFDTFLAGPVLVTFAPDAGPAHAPRAATPLAARSTAGPGQVSLDSAKALAKIDTPFVQGVAAHFDATATHALSSSAYQSANSYGAVMTVSMDGQPLVSSRKVLVQYATRSRPTGWKQVPATLAVEGQSAQPGFELKDFGRAPWQVEAAQLLVRLNNPGLREATVLDMNGMAVATVPLRKHAQGVEFDFPPQAMYVLLR